jgi:hypothetical protein
MGKTTNTFTEQYVKLAGTCKTTWTELEKAVKESKDIDKEVINKDPATDDDWNRMEKAHTRMMDLCNKQLEPLNKQVTELTDKFETYLKKKEKSKNPFKTKNSLPAAKCLVAEARRIITSNTAVIRRAKGLKG